MDAELRGVVLGLLIVSLAFGVLLIALDAAPTVVKLAHAVISDLR